MNNIANKIDRIVNVFITNVSYFNNMLSKQRRHPLNFC